MKNLMFIMAQTSQETGWVEDILRSFFFTLDKLIYTVFGWVMQLIFDIVEVSSNEALQDFYGGIQTRIYAILAIFMLFKITISMLNYLVNPDSIGDKERGVGKLVSRVIISLIMLICFSNAFSLINRIQIPILEALPRIVLGTEDTSNDSLGDQMADQGERIAFSVYNGVWFNSNCADKANVYDEHGKPSISCFMYGYTIADIDDHLNDSDPSNKGYYKYEYFPLIGFVVGIFMTIVMVSISFDVSVRVFKLMILEIIAPIPIMSYIDPKSSKDGAFSKWIKMVISVWADIFIKMGVVYFVVLVIAELITGGVITSITSSLWGEDGVLRGSMVLIALVIGLLFFAKDAPKFICDALGIKMGENGKLFGGLGKIMAAGALGAGAIGSYKAAKMASHMADEENGKSHHFGNRLKNVGAGLLGGLGGLGAGYSAAAGAKDHYARAVMDAMAKRNATTLAAGAAGSTALGRGKSTLSGLFKGETLAAAGKRNIAAMEAGKSALSSVKSRASGEMVKKDWTYGALGNAGDTDVYGNTIGNVNYKDFLSRMNAAKTRGDSTVNFYDEQGNALEVSMEYAEKQLGYLQKNNESSYIEKIVSGSAPETDATLTTLIEDAEAKNPGLTISNRSDVNDNIEILEREITKAKRENAKNEQNDRFSGKK